MGTNMSMFVGTGYGKFHYILLLLCGFAFGCYPCEALNASFLMPAAACDLNLTSRDKGWFSSITFIGMMVGSYIWGSLGDSLGRRKILVVSLLVDFLFSIASSLAPSFTLIVILRFLAGVGLSGVFVIFSFFSEFQPTSKRGGMVSLLDGFTIEGHVLMTGLAWCIIPLPFAYVSESFTYHPWRLFIAFCAVLSLLAALGLLWLPESPKFLLTKGRQGEALQVFQRMFHQNTGRPAEEYPFTQFIEEFKEETSEYSTRSEKIKKACHDVLEQSRMLVRKPLLLNVTLMIFIQFSLQFANAGLLLWLPELFHKFEIYLAQHPNESLTVCQIVNFRNENEVHLNCQPDQQVYIYGLIIALAPIPGYFWTYFQIDKLGRKFFIVFGLLLSSVCAGLVLVIRTPIGDTLAIGLFSFFGTLTFNALNVFTTELFPTRCRATAFSIIFVSARLGSILGTIIFGVLFDVMCELPIGMFSTFAIGGALLAMALPDTVGKTLD